MRDFISSRPRKSWYTKSAAAFRWVHIYVSMLSFAALMFFAVTGLTLNHPTWFGASEQSIRDMQGTLPTELLAPIADDETMSAEEAADNTSQVDKLAVCEWLRSRHHLKGRVAEFETDEFECMVVFKGPGYSADAFVDRATGDYMLTETTTGMMAVLNDLHKGRDSGPQWSWVIDISAVVTVLVSLSGFGLLLYIKRRRTTGILTAVVGTVLLVAAWAFWVP